MKIEKVVLLGLGGIGGYIASYLNPFLQKNFIVTADAKRCQKIMNNGLIVNGNQQRFHVIPYDEANFYADLVIVTTKFNQLREGLEAIKGFVGPETLIMCPLNGVDAEDIAGEYYKKENIIPSFVFVSVMHEGNVIDYTPSQGIIRFGYKNDSRSTSIKELFDATGLPNEIPDDIVFGIWKKYVSNVSTNQVSAVLGLTYGDFVNIPEAEYLRELAAKEAIEIAHKKGIMIPDDFAYTYLNSLKKTPQDHKCSMLQDIEHGRKTEVDMFAGSMMRMGKEFGVPTPVNEFLYNAIKTLEAKMD